MTLKNGTNINFTFTKASVTISGDNAVDGYLLTRAPYDITKKYSQTDDGTSSSSRSTPRTASTYTLYKIDMLDDSLTSSSKRHNTIE